MSIEKNSLLEEDQETAEPLQASSNPPPEGGCNHDGDCPDGYRCVDGQCVPV